METALWLNLLVSALFLIGMGLTFLSLPGNTLIFLLALFFGFYEGFTGITYKVLLLLLALLISGELTEFFTGAMAVRRAAASKSTFKAAVAGAFLGGLLGTAVLPLIGSLVGAVLGVFIASYLAEYLSTANAQKSKQVAFHAAKGQFLGTVIKSIISILMVITAIYNLPW